MFRFLLARNHSASSAVVVLACCDVTATPLAELLASLEAATAGRTLAEAKRASC